MEIKKPRSREKGEAQEGKGIFKRGSGTGQGPVGTGKAPSGINKPSQGTQEIQKELQKKIQEKQAEKESDDSPTRGMPSKGLSSGIQKGSERGIGLEDIVDALSGNNQQSSNANIFGNMNNTQQAPNPPHTTNPNTVNSTGSSSAGTGSGYGYGGAGSSGAAQATTRRRGGIGCLSIIIILLVLYFLLKAIGLIGGSNSTSNNASNLNTTTSSSSGSGTSYGFGGTGGSTTFGSSSSGDTSVAAGSGYSSGWQLTSNNGVLNTDVAEGSRAKFTTIQGNGQDLVTILVYMCGTDLESNYAMATKDLQEMLAADLSDNVRIVIFTGGCARWQNDVMSSSVNQIYEIAPEGLRRINDNAGTSSMTDPDTLSAFIKWGAANYPANRMNLILWDHGGGSVSGYGYDQLHQSSGSMTLTDINSALSSAGVKFDFIGFDACLMATVETGLMAANYADYLIASEEVEPGIGWYYTDWLTLLSSNTGISTLELGKQIIDDYTIASQQDCPGQDTTLSIVDLAELQTTVPAKLTAFGTEANGSIEAGNYQTISKARTSSREFSTSSRIDQIDFIHFANLIGTDASKDLAKTLVDAVKYNRTSKSMTNAYGISVYFPYRSLGSVDTMSATYAALGIDDSFAKCLRSFAKLQVGGQASSGGSSSPLWSLLNSDGSGYWSSSSNYGSGAGSGYDSYGGSLSNDALQALLESLLGSDGSSVNYDSYGLFGLGRDNTKFLTQDETDISKMATYISENIMDAEDFAWKENSEGYASIQLTDDQWEKISSVEMSLFYDDGEGYIDMGLDNIFEIDEERNLLPVVDNSWISIDGQPVAYYHLLTYEDETAGEYTIMGRVPVMLNDVRADLILVFDQDNPEGYIAGARYTYGDNDDVDTVAKAQESLTEGDKIDFLCDYYTYDGSFQDSYYLGEQYVVEDPEAITISNTTVGSDILVSYKFMDIFGETYWTPTLS